MAPNMRDNGEMINSMDMVSKFGLMDLHMKVILLIHINTALVNMYGVMDKYMMENGWRTNYMGKVYCIGLMDVNMKEIFIEEICMEKVHTHGQMEEDMKDSILVIRNMYI
jgi:hypothetical protein